MSLGYAEKLSYREDIGNVGMSELFDPPYILQAKIEELAKFIEESKHLVAFTGAGISTSCGIPDFRGPTGIWTLQRQGKPLPKADMPFHRAMPGLTHMALAELEKAGILKFVISQNIDGLHLRSGIPREKLAELHGNSFREICSSCGKEYVRDFEVETIGMKETGRHCSDLNCGGKLKDTVLDWEDALPPKEMIPAEKHCKMADLIICLGTSLQITPACNLPLKSVRGGGKLVIINLQPTPKDKKAALLIHAQVDKVIAGVMQFLNYKIPAFVRVDCIQVSLSYPSKKKRYAKWKLRISSIHGNKAALPFIKSVEASFPDRPRVKSAFLTDQPFKLQRETLRSKPFKVFLKLNFGNGCDCSSVELDYPIDFQDSTEYFEHGKGNVIESLRNRALADATCGHISPIQRKQMSDSKGTYTEYAIVTSLVRHEYMALEPKALISNGTIEKRGIESIEVEAEDLGKRMKLES
uniref:NAD-dependent protein deacetylase SRT1 n=1 Tax=Juniperus phoenicea TaxID=61308 RepID=A0A3S6N1J9_9CONI|nr:sirtuin 1 [Juniperus phoenicea]